MGQLDGRVAFITGGARGQGRSHSLALAAEGADVVVTDVAADEPVLGYPMATPEQLAETVKLVDEYGVRALGLQVDARDTTQLNDAVAQTVSQFGRMDILLANHGIVDFSTVENDHRRSLVHDRRHQPDRDLQGHPGRHPAHAQAGLRPDRRDLVDGRPTTPPPTSRTTSPPSGA